MCNFLSVQVAFVLFGKLLCVPMFTQTSRNSSYSVWHTYINEWLTYCTCQRAFQKRNTGWKLSSDTPRAWRQISSSEVVIDEMPAKDAQTSLVRKAAQLLEHSWQCQAVDDKLCPHSGTSTEQWQGPHHKTVIFMEVPLPRGLQRKQHVNLATK